jgi:hypothetical protein
VPFDYSYVLGENSPVDSILTGRKRFHRSRSALDVIGSPGVLKYELISRLKHFGTRLKRADFRAWGYDVAMLIDNDKRLGAERVVNRNRLMTAVDGAHSDVDGPTHGRGIRI